MADLTISHLGKCGTDFGRSSNLYIDCWKMRQDLLCFWCAMCESQKSCICCFVICMLTCILWECTNWFCLFSLIWCDLLCCCIPLKNDTMRIPFQLFVSLDGLVALIGLLCHAISNCATGIVKFEHFAPISCICAPNIFNSRWYELLIDCE